MKTKAANRCRCGGRKLEGWHLLCPWCWDLVPEEMQQRLYFEYKKECGSAAHNLVIREIYRLLGKRGPTAVLHRMVWSTWNRGVHHIADPNTVVAVTLCGEKIKRPKAFVKTEFQNVSCNECREVFSNANASRKEVPAENNPGDCASG